MPGTVPSVADPKQKFWIRFGSGSGLKLVSDSDLDSKSDPNPDSNPDSNPIFNPDTNLGFGSRSETGKKLLFLF